MKFILLLIVSVLIISCGHFSKEEQYYEIKMEKITGDRITRTYKLPKDITFSIRGNRGDYYLVCYTKNRSYMNPAGKLIRKGIVDYKIQSISQSYD